MALKTLDNYELSNRRILIRIDINAALINNKPLDSPRFTEHAITISELIKKKAKVIIIAHQGRKGDTDCISLKDHAEILASHVKSKIEFCPDLFGKEAQKAIENLKGGDSILLENVRFYPDEDIKYEKNNYLKFCKQFDLFINDAFSVSHRAQGSIIFPPKFLPSTMGRIFQKEIIAADHFVKDKSEKKVYLLGGSKLEDYISFFKVLNEKNNKILASGVLGNAFLACQGIDLGYENKWLKEKGYDKLFPKLKDLLNKYKDQIILPIDFAIGTKKREEILLEKAPIEEKLLDIGSTTIALFKEHIARASAIFVKGPLGFCENSLFSKGTVEILKYISSQTKNKKTYSLLGGGHLTTTLMTYNIPNNFSSISLSGGALMAYLTGEPLPGLEALKRSK